LQISENKANKELIAVLEKKIEDLRKEKTSLKSDPEEQASTKKNPKHNVNPSKQTFFPEECNYPLSTHKFLSYSRP